MQSATYLLPSLELQAQGKLNDAWVVQTSIRGRRLQAEVLQTSSGVGWHVIRVVESVEEIGAKPDIESFLDLKVLVKRDVDGPRARPDNVGARVGVIESPERSVVTRSIRQVHSQLADIGPGAVRAGWPDCGGRESAVDVRRVRCIEIAREPLPIAIAAAGDIQRGPLVGR